MNFNCWSQNRGEQIIFTPQWTPQSQFAGYYAAAELGFYKDAGLDVKINHPNASVFALDMLNKGQSDIITAKLVDAINSKDDGADIINIMQLMPHSMITLISHNPINGDVKALDGKKIAAWTTSFPTLYATILKEKGIDVEWVHFLSGVNIFLTKSVDAMMAMSYNELQIIKETNYDIKESQILRLNNLGYTIPEDGLYTTNAFLEKHPEFVEKFIAASIKGWQWVAENREKAVQIVLKIAEECHIPTNQYHQAAMLDDILSSGVAATEQDFYLNKKDYLQTLELFYKAGLIKDKPSFEAFVLKRDK